MCDVIFVCTEFLLVRSTPDRMSSIAISNCLDNNTLSKILLASSDGPLYIHNIYNNNNNNNIRK
jgi:hypothetical protein